MTLGRVSIVATVISTDGAMAAAVSDRCAARRSAASVLAGLTVIVVGVLLAVSGGGQSRAGPRRDGLAALAAVGSAVVLRDHVPRARARSTPCSRCGWSASGASCRCVLVTLPGARGDAPRAAAAQRLAVDRA